MSPGYALFVAERLELSENTVGVALTTRVESNIDWSDRDREAKRTGQRGGRKVSGRKNGQSDGGGFGKRQRQTNTARGQVCEGIYWGEEGGSSEECVGEDVSEGVGERMR